MGLHLLMSLRKHIKEVSQFATKGVIFHGSKEKGFSVPISKLVEALEDYSFPMKEEILEHMNAIRHARNRLFHEMMLVDPKEPTILDTDIDEIAEHTETLVNRIDLLYSNFPVGGTSPEELMENIQEKKANESAPRNKTKK
jgi:hypothetical protein